jgi:hypothetical protein
MASGDIAEPVRAEEIKAIPVRHPGRWIAGAIILVLAAALAKSYYIERHYGRGATRDLPETPVQRLRRSLQLRHEWT